MYFLSMYFVDVYFVDKYFVDVCFVGVYFIYMHFVDMLACVFSARALQTHSHARTRKKECVPCASYTHIYTL